MPVSKVLITIVLFLGLMLGLLLIVPSSNAYLKSLPIINSMTSATYFKAGFPYSPRSKKAVASVEESLKAALTEKGLEYGAPVFIRIFKQQAILQVWVAREDNTFLHFKDYDICTFSGELGPKLKEGDKQSPEGFYFVSPSRLNPSSRFHLSFNLGFPNQYDRHHGRTGSALMVHGNCVSIGCYAMTDPYINEIYALVQSALEQGQPFVRVHAFPFVMNDENMEKNRASDWYDFWLNLKTGYDHFEKHKKPPQVEVESGIYVFN